MRTLLAALALSIALGAGAGLAADRALLIGVDRYPRLPEHLQLTGAANDVRLMQRLAREVWGFQADGIKLLLDGEATARSILAAIETWLVEGTSPGDRVLLTYSGHGYFRRNADGSEATGFDQTLAPSDVERVEGGYANMIADDAIGRLLERLEGREVMLIVDSCHSGTITRALDPRARRGPAIVRSLDASGRARGLRKGAFERLRRTRAFASRHAHVMTWTAVAATEKAQEDMSLPDDLRLGVFTRAFAEGLLERRADLNGNGAVTPFELIGYVRRRAAAYCDRNRCDTHMTPTLEWPATFPARNLLDWRPRAAPAPKPPPPDVAAKKEERPAPGSPEPAPSAPEDILVPSEASPVRIDLLPGPKVKLGQRLRVRVTSRDPGYLIVLDVRDGGRVVQLFPSKCARPSRRLRAGAPLTMPDATYGCVFEATEPGRGRLLAIVTRDSVALDALLAPHRDLEPIPDAPAYLAGLAQRLMALWTGDARDRPVRWSLATAGYEVVR